MEISKIVNLCGERDRIRLWLARPIELVATITTSSSSPSSTLSTITFAFERCLFDGEPSIDVFEMLEIESKLRLRARPYRVVVVLWFVSDDGFTFGCAGCDFPPTKNSESINQKIESDDWNARKFVPLNCCLIEFKSMTCKNVDPIFSSMCLSLITSCTWNKRFFSYASFSHTFGAKRPYLSSMASHSDWNAADRMPRAFELFRHAANSRINVGKCFSFSARHRPIDSVNLWCR